LDGIAAPWSVAGGRGPRAPAGLALRQGTIARLEYGPDDDPLTETDRAGIEEGRPAIAAGDYVDEQALRERPNALRSRR
jgi:hypothetical protein